MKESINLIGGLLGNDLFKCVQILNMSNVWHEKFKWLNTKGIGVSMVEYKKFNYLYLGKLGLSGNLTGPSKKNFGKPKMS